MSTLVLYRQILKICILNIYIPEHDPKLGFKEREIKARLLLSRLAGVKRPLKIFACKGILLQ